MNSSKLSRMPVEDIMVGIIQDSSFFSFNWFYLLDLHIAKLIKCAMNSSDLSRPIEEDIRNGIQDSSFFVSFYWLYLPGFLIAKLIKKCNEQF